MYVCIYIYIYIYIYACTHTHTLYNTGICMIRYDTIYDMLYDTIPYNHIV